MKEGFLGKRSFPKSHFLVTFLANPKSNAAGRHDQPWSYQHTLSGGKKEPRERQKKKATGKAEKTVVKQSPIPWQE